LSEDPTFRTSEVDARLTRVNALYTRVASTPKPKPKRKPPGNIKVDNITIDGNSGGNWEDFVSFGDGNSYDDMPPPPPPPPRGRRPQTEEKESEE
jgi:hypothetical protein